MGKSSVRLQKSTALEYMQDIEPIIKDYLLAWNASESKQRADLMAKLVAEDCFYADSHLPEPIITRELHYQFIDR